MPDDDTGELTPQDVDDYTDGRLAAGDAETARKLRAALRAARNFCGWHVAPARTETLTLDGPGTRLLSLPTRRIVALTSVTENGVTVPVDRLDVSKRLGVVEKQAGLWSRRYGSIEVTLTHGFSGEDAADFEDAVLAAVDGMSTFSDGERESADMKRKRVDDTEIEWFEQAKRLIDHGQLAAYQLIQKP